MTIRWTEEELEAWKREKEDAAANPYLPGPTPKARHKYRAEPTVVDGIRFDSKGEARYYVRLRDHQAVGQIRGFIQQVPFHLPGRKRLVIDFGVIENDGTIHFDDYKGFETPVFRLKFDQARELYPWADFRLIRRGDL